MVTRFSRLGDHLFFDKNQGSYLPLRELAKAASLLSLSAPDSAVLVSESLRHLSADVSPLLATAPVFDLSVSRDHNYFAEGVLVHNKSGAGPCDNQNVYSAVVCEGPGTVHLSESHFGRVAVSTNPPVLSMGGSNAHPGTEELLVSFPVSDDSCDGTVALSLARTSDYGFFEVALSDTPCPESQVELNWQQLPLSEIHSPVVVDASSAPHILARYHRYAASCVTVGGDADADLCPE